MESNGLNRVVAAMVPRRLFGVLALLAIAAVALTASAQANSSSGPAVGPLDTSDCPSTYMCYWTQTNFNGTYWRKQVINYPTSWETFCTGCNPQSWYNHSIYTAQTLVPSGGTYNHGAGDIDGTANWPNDNGTYKRKKP